MLSLREYITRAAAEKRAIGHFNFSTLEVLRAIVESSKKAGVPVIVGLSEGERNFVGIKQAVALVASFRSEGSPVFLNADHSYSFDSVKEAVDAGFDSVIFDGAKLSFEENVKITKECVKYARACGRNVLVEGELGFIGTSSQILKKIPDGVKISHEYLTKPEDAHRFVKETEVDLIAPAVGNIHGMLSPHRRPAEEAEWVGDPPLDVSRIAAIRESAGVPVVLHGASGNSAEDIRAAVVSGASIVHWNTELRAAYRTGIMRGLEENPDELAPYKYLKEPLLAVEKVVEEKIKLL